jgi:hypothetical protein
LGSEVNVSERGFSENQPNNTCMIERAEEGCQNADGEQWDPGVDLSESGFTEEQERVIRMMLREESGDFVQGSKRLPV